MSKVGFLRELMNRFRKDQGGNVLMLFGLSVVPMIGVVGVAVDYSRASAARQSLNAAIDSAALMAARDAQKLTDSQLTTRINAWLKDNLPSDVKDEFTTAQVTIDRTARTVKIVANANVPTTIARVLGTQNIPVASTSQSTWGTNTIELALVLDNTGSMAQSGKMDQLKLASHNLLGILKDAVTETDQIKVSIVPFATQVKLDTTFKNENWLRYTMTRTTGSGKNQKTETIAKTTWEGCVTDRDQNYDVSDADPTTGSAAAYPADFCDQSTLATVMPLSSNWSALNAKIDTMTPTGNTNVTIGAVWGLSTLTPQVPFTEAKPANTPRLSKYMILLTDGTNTENRFSTNQTTIDGRTALACTNIKAAGVRVYTIRVIDGNRTLLRNCASDPDSMYKEVSSASQLNDVFTSIAKEISQVRLTM